MDLCSNTLPYWDIVCSTWPRAQALMFFCYDSKFLHYTTDVWSKSAQLFIFSVCYLQTSLLLPLHLIPPSEDVGRGAIPLPPGLQTSRVPHSSPHPPLSSAPPLPCCHLLPSCPPLQMQNADSLLRLQNVDASGSKCSYLLISPCRPFNPTSCLYIYTISFTHFYVFTS
jgi:hypothetical protein